MRKRRFLCYRNLLRSDLAVLNYFDISETTIGEQHPTGILRIGFKGTVAQGSLKAVILPSFLGADSGLVCVNFCAKKIKKFLKRY